MQNYVGHIFYSEHLKYDIYASWSPVHVLFPIIPRFKIFRHEAMQIMYFSWYL